jgi:hypothetical protein
MGLAVLRGGFAWHDQSPFWGASLCFLVSLGLSPEKGGSLEGKLQNYKK